ncbi:SGNH/GDSL hydrolase family protein [Kibdelosporangium philippinense]|uniref:SGNH/GDSL hydrolase family protein n=1 Tax=Kibdelosporangium philippinense TaxID=211113 RepID=A0ABS8Z724_9PSEU|nr:SGNH/GDSL hydrolase family protein [Kibdelosporangium philippinense]MCE7002590.1 SGNH/GDSL hydrolase family protein [Kibdelosporangium philippinense]
MRKLWAAVVAGVVVSTLAAPQASATGNVMNVVALGDSSASGAGAGDYLDGTGTPGGCWRSANSYSANLVPHLRANGRTVNFTNVTCSGAEIPDLRQQFKGQPPQLDSLKKDTNVVFLTVGANDIALADYGGLCIQAACEGAPTDAVLQRMDALGKSMIGLLSEIGKRSPYAKVVVTGYGRQMIPGENAPNVPLDPICGPGIITTPEREGGSTIATKLDATLRLATVVSRWNRVNSVYVSQFAKPGELTPEFSGHSLCEANVPYYRGFDALAPGQEGPEAVLHLNKPGHATLAALIKRKLHS